MNKICNLGKSAVQAEKLCLEYQLEHKLLGSKGLIYRKLTLSVNAADCSAEATLTSIACQSKNICMFIYPVQDTTVTVRIYKTKLYKIS